MAALALVATPVGPARAEYSVGGSFASPGYGASAWGMGGAAIASIADEGAVYWNPAMLSVISGRRLGFSYTNIVPGTDTRLSYVAYAQAIKRGPTDEAGMEFAAHAVGVIYGNLGVELADGQTYNENTLRIAYAYCPEHFVSFGIGFTGLFASSDVPDFGANGSTLDASLRIALMKGLTAAAVGRQVLSQGKFDDGTNLSIPRSYALGVSYEAFNRLLVETDIEAQFGNLSRWMIGGRYTVYRDMVAARAGLATVMVGDNRTVAYLGLGVHVRMFYVDYAASFDREEAFSNAHRFSLGLGF
jgi:long-subunit fatty acid transport protein